MIRIQDIFLLLSVKGMWSYLLLTPSSVKDWKMPTSIILQLFSELF